MTLCINHELPQTLTVHQVAELLGICLKNAYSLVKCQNLAIRVGDKRLVVPRDRFLTYLDKQDDFFSEEG